MNGISINIARCLCRYEIIEEKDIDKCRYGLDVLISSSLEIICIFFLSVIIGNFAETVLFFATFIPLRVYAGGYHAKTKIRCFAVSVAVYFVFSCVMKYLPEEYYRLISCLCMVFSLFAVMLYARLYTNKESFKKRRYNRLFCLLYRPFDLKNI